MRIPTFEPRLPLPVLRREVRYTLLQIQFRPWAKPWVPPFTDLLTEIEGAVIGVGKLTDALEAAEAAIDFVDQGVNSVVMHLAGTARLVLKGEVLVAFMSSLFGSEKPSDLVRPKLGAKLVRVRTWPAILKDAPVQALKDLIPAVTAAITAADAAIQAQSVASGALEAFRASVHTPLVEKANGQRKALGGDAKKQLHDADGGSEQEGLFLLSRRDSRQNARPDSLEKTQAEIASLQAALAVAQQRLAAQQAQQQAQEQANQKRKEVEQKVLELQKARAQTDAQLAELQGQLAGH